MFLAVMNQHTDFLGPDLVGTVTEHKQHGVNHVGFTAAIWANDRGKALKKTNNIKLRAGMCVLVLLEDSGLPCFCAIFYINTNNFPLNYV